MVWVWCSQIQSHLCFEDNQFKSSHLSMSKEESQEMRDEIDHGKVDGIIMIICGGHVTNEHSRNKLMFYHLRIRHCISCLNYCSSTAIQCIAIVRT